MPTLTTVSTLQLTFRQNCQKIKALWSLQKSQPMVAKISEPMRAKTPEFRNTAILLLKTISGIKTAALNFGFSY